MKTIQSRDFEIKEDDSNYDYQPVLTTKLDSYLLPFNQETINEIVLWKVNRYAGISDATLLLVNQINEAWDEELTRNVLLALLSEKGIQLPMASTILRFKNRNKYQIIDQRVYRILYGEELKINQQKTERSILIQIELYLKYLEDLRKVCFDLNIPFDMSDRILYNVDKRINSVERLKNW
jgi:thermostable 8-oxoguanine DNA glycosylase